MGLTNHLPDYRNSPSRIQQEKGFTLVELLVAMVIALIVMAAVYTTYSSQQQQYLVQEQVAGMQQNMRAATYFMSRELRMAGYDPTQSGKFKITDIRLDANGNSTITFPADFNDDGILGSDETISYSIFSGADGTPDLRRNAGAGNQLLAEGVESLGLAYAFDQNGDGELDTDARGHVIWAVDTDGDNQPDLNLDTNGDGVIDIKDDTTPGNGVLEGVPLASPVPLSDIRAVKIWVLARTDKAIRGEHDTNTYVVGRRVIIPTGADTRFKHELLTTTVRCRNLNS